MRVVRAAALASVVLSVVAVTPAMALEVGAEAGVATVKISWPPGHLVSPARVLRAYVTLGSVSGYDVGATIEQVGVMGAGVYPDSDGDGLEDHAALSLRATGISLRAERALPFARGWALVARGSLGYWKGAADWDTYFSSLGPYRFSEQAEGTLGWSVGLALTRRFLDASWSVSADLRGVQFSRSDQRSTPWWDMSGLQLTVGAGYRW